MFHCNSSQRRRTTIETLPNAQRTRGLSSSYQSNFLRQGGITCEAIDEPGKSAKAIDKRVIINFRDKNVVIARFRDKNVVIAQ